MSDQERDKLSNETNDEGGEDVEAHKLSRDMNSTRGADDAAEDDSSDDVEAHKLSKD